MVVLCKSGLSLYLHSKLPMSSACSKFVCTGSPGKTKLCSRSSLWNHWSLRDGAGVSFIALPHPFLQLHGQLLQGFAHQCTPGTAHGKYYPSTGCKLLKAACARYENNHQHSSLKRRKNPPSCLQGWLEATAAGCIWQMIILHVYTALCPHNAQHDGTHPHHISWGRQSQSQH